MLPNKIYNKLKIDNFFVLEEKYLKKLDASNYCIYYVVHVALSRDVPIRFDMERLLQWTFYITNFNDGYHQRCLQWKRYF